MRGRLLLVCPVQIRELPGGHRGVPAVGHGQAHRGRDRRLRGEPRRGVPREQLRGRPGQALRLPAAGEQDHEDRGLRVPGKAQSLTSLNYNDLFLADMRLNFYVCIYICLAKILNSKKMLYNIKDKALAFIY